MRQSPYKAIKDACDTSIEFTAMNLTLCTIELEVGTYVCLKTSRETCRTIEKDGVSGCRPVDCSLFHWTGTLSHRYVDTYEQPVHLAAILSQGRIKEFLSARGMKLGVPAARKTFTELGGGSDSSTSLPPPPPPPPTPPLSWLLWIHHCIHECIVNEKLCV